MGRTYGWQAAVSLVVVALASTAEAHDHHGVSKIEDGQTISDESIDTILWIHIALQMTAFGLLFPLGMIFGLTKNRWHVPTQVLASALAIVGFVLGHMHGGREFREHNIHAVFAPVLNGSLFAQIIMGIYLKLHLETGINGRIRRVIRPLHSVLGKTIPILSWTQMLLGGVTALGFCDGDDNAVQCIQHFSLGSAFIAYAIIMALFLLVGRTWLRRSNHSQEFFDSIIIAAWGFVNMLLAHRRGTLWTTDDWKTTTLGFLWLVGGLAGVWLSRDRDGYAQRNFAPGFIIMITGWGMSAQPQELIIAAEVQKVFGYTVMAAGLARIVEVAFVVKDKAGVSEGRETNSWQYVPIFLLFSSGILFLGSTHEQLQIVAQSGLDHSSYLFILFALSFVFFLFVHILIGLYDQLSSIPADPAPVSAGVDVTRGVQVRDAEEFELEGLVTDDEDEDGEEAAKKPREVILEDEDGLSSPSTLGRNNENRTR